MIKLKKFNFYFTILILIWITSGCPGDRKNENNDQVPSVLKTITPEHADFFVSPNGNDNASGAQEAPFATISRAQDAVRERLQEDNNQDIVVLIREGTYFLESPLQYGPEDSGKDEQDVIYAAYPGEEVVISGGSEISGWEEGEDNIWSTTISEVKQGELFFRQLFVEGERKPRARYPNAGNALRITQVGENHRELEINKIPLVNDLSGMHAEMVVIQNWSISRVQVTSSDQNHITAQNPVGWIGHGEYTVANEGDPVYFEHAPEFIDRPGEWYLNRETGELKYKAEDGENPNEMTFIAPRLKKLLSVRGAETEPARNIHFRGLHFRHAGWNLPSIGYMGIQAGHHGTSVEERTYVLPLALEFLYTENCLIGKCEITHVGSTAIGFGAGSRNNRVIASQIHDIGGNGIMVGWRGTGEMEHDRGNGSLSADWPDSTDVPRNNEIANNLVEKPGQIAFGSVGIFDAFSHGTYIHHNVVRNTPYTGISTGFRWNTSETSQKNCTIAYNHIYQVMQTLSDGGGIYTLGYQPGTVLRNNHIHDVGRGKFAYAAPNNGIFFDQGTNSLHVEDQVIYHTSGKPIRFNQCKKEDLTWENNHFGVAPDDPDFPTELANKAGLMPQYKDTVETASKPVGFREPEAKTPSGEYIYWKEHRIDDQELNGVPISGSDGLVMGDLDQDGHPDIVSVHESDTVYDGKARGHIRIAYGTEDPDQWELVTLAEGAEAGAAEDVAIGDLNGDGHPDIIAACELEHLIYFQNPGENTRTRKWERVIPPVTANRGSWIRVFFADLNKDGRLEIVAPNKGSQTPGTQGEKEFPYSWFKVRGNPLEEANWREHLLAKGNIPENTRPVDLDGDGDQDIIGASRGENRILWFENSGEDPVRFQTHDIHVGKQAQSYPVRGVNMDFSDFNQDGRLDIVLFSSRAGRADVLWLEQPENLSDPWQYHTIGAVEPDHLIGIVVADINGDDHPDVMTGTYSGGPRTEDGPNVTVNDPLGRIAWFENPGDPKQKWIRHDISRRKRGMYDKFVPHDMDGDGDKDFVATRGNSGKFDGVFWLEQVRSKAPLKRFIPSRKFESEEMGLPDD